MQPLISVIVPVYKVEEYLSKCVDSIINQTYKNLEIILVDDGSPDNCGKICDDYAQKDSRIKVVHKENGGLSDARNAGLEIATGDYIAFIDSDDWISLDAYENMLNVAVQQKADIVECNINYDYDGRIEKYNTDKYALYTDCYSIMEAYILYYRIKTVVWNKLYKKEVLGNIQFEYGKYNEDEFFTYKVLANANRFVHLEEYYYYYYQRDNSIMGKYSLKRLDALEGFEERMVFIREHYPSFYISTKVSFCLTCLFHYQLLMKNKGIQGYKEGKRKISDYRKSIKLCITDVKKIPFINKWSLLLSNTRAGLTIVCLLRNIFNYGL